MVAASKMRRAQQQALAGRPYAELMNEVLAEVTAGASDFSHPLMAPAETGKRALIVVSTDKGLCGGLNSNLFREATKVDKDNTVFISAGRKAAQFLSRTNRISQPSFLTMIHLNLPKPGRSRRWLRNFSSKVRLPGGYSVH